MVTASAETLTEEGLASSSAKLYPRGTLLIALYGATVGKLGLLDIEWAATNQAVCAIQPRDADLVPYLWWVLRAQRTPLIAKGKGGAQSNISQEIVKSVRVPHPPAQERNEIVSAIQRTDSVVEALIAEVTHAERKAASIRAAILREAFAGRLVPQNRDDEPVSELFGGVKA